jgi:hypothetical protein
MGDPARRSLILLGIFAGVVLALFVVSVVHRPDDDRPGSGVSSDRREGWRARWFPSDPVAPGQLGGCAGAPGAFVVAGSCELKIAAADVRSRRLVVEALDPMELRRTLNVGGRRMAMRARLKPGKSEQIFVGEDGETIGLRCLGGLTCRGSVR